MNLNHLSYFRVLGNVEHYTKAANELSITQPSLSHAIRALEDDLGTALFEKQGRNVKLTKYGKIFHQIVDSSLSDLEQGEKKLRNLTNQNNGKIDLAFIYTLGAYFVPSLVKDFLSLEDNKEISFSFKQNTTKDLIKGLKDELYDIAFCSYVANEPNINFVKIHQQQLVTIVPLDHPLAKYDSIDLTQIQDYPIIFFDKNSGIRPIIDDLFQQISIVPNIICEVEEDSAIAGLVSIGYGIAVVPDIMLLKNFNVKVLQITSPPHERYIYMATVKDHYLTPSVQKFYNYVLINRPHIL